MPIPSSDFEKVLADHNHLNELFDRVLAVMAANAHNRQELSTLLADLKVQVTEHFAQEERDGLFERIASLAPRLEHEAMALQKQHGALAESLDSICDRSGLKTLDAARKQQLLESFRQFLTQFSKHEEDENRLLQEVYDRDVGSKD